MLNRRAIFVNSYKKINYFFCQNMQLSVIIVNYNVKHFLEQCLFSVTKAINEKLIPGEIIVVDNNSNDGSIDYLMPQFPSVTFILNTGYLPAIRPVVLTEVLNHSTAMQKFSEQSLQIADQLYAKEYSAWKDLKFIFGSYKRLGA